MYRVCAIVLLGIIAFWLDAPAFTSGTEAEVPLCCRASGRHKCAMRLSRGALAESDAKTAVQIVAPKCPFLPGMGFTTVTSSAPLPGGGQYCFGSLSSQPAVQAQAEARFRISFARARQKRGPPSFLS